MAVEASVDVLRDVLDAFNRHDLDAIMSHFSDDCVFESPRGPDRWGSRFVGVEEVRRGLGIGDGHVTLTDEAGLIVAVAVLEKAPADVNK